MKAEAAVCLQGFGFAFPWAKVNPHPAVPDLMVFSCANRSQMRAGWRAVRANPAKANTDRGAAEQDLSAGAQSCARPGTADAGPGSGRVSARRPFPPAATAKAGPRIPAAAAGTSGVKGTAGCPRPLRDAPGHRLGKSCTKPRWCPCRWGSQGSELSQSHPPSHTGARRCQRQGHPLWHHFTAKLVRQTSAGWRGGCCRRLRRARGGRWPPAPCSVGAEVGTTPMARCHLEGFAFARFGSRITEGTFTPLSLQLFTASEPGLGTGTFFHPAPSVSLGTGN